MKVFGVNATLARLIVRLCRDEDGQDVIEYALLSAFIGTVGVLAWQGVRTGIGSAYIGWDSGTQQRACIPNPGTTVCDQVGGIQ